MSGPTPAPRPGSPAPASRGAGGAGRPAPGAGPGPGRRHDGHGMPTAEVDGFRGRSGGCSAPPPGAAADRRRASCSPSSAFPSRSSARGSWARPPTSSSRASSASSCRPASPGSSPSMRSRPARPAAQMLASMHAWCPARGSTSRCSRGSCRRDRGLRVQLAVRLGARPTSWPASPSGPSTGSGSDVDLSSAGCRSRTSTASRAATSCPASPTTSTTSASRSSRA